MNSWRRAIRNAEPLSQKGEYGFLSPWASPRVQFYQGSQFSGGRLKASSVVNSKKVAPAPREIKAPRSSDLSFCRKVNDFNTLWRIPAAPAPFLRYFIKHPRNSVHVYERRDVFSVDRHISSKGRTRIQSPRGVRWMSAFRLPVSGERPRSGPSRSRGGRSAVGPPLSDSSPSPR